MEGQSKREGATGGGGAGKGRGDIGNIENNFGGEERNAPSEIDGWLWCQDLWLIKNFPYVARAFFGFAALRLARHCCCCCFAYF